MAIASGIINKDFVVLSPSKSATIERSDATLYERLNQNYEGFKGHELIACHEFDQDWSTWEIHPKGDEIVILLSGRVSFILKCEAGEESIELKDEGSYVIIPKNIWHTAKTGVKSKLLFITPGEATEHKPLES